MSDLGTHTDQRLLLAAAQAGDERAFRRLVEPYRHALEVHCYRMLALTGGFRHALWMLGAIALIALPAIFALVRRGEVAQAMTKAAVHEPEPCSAPAS